MFKNLPLLDFSIASIRENFEKTLNELSNTLLKTPIEVSPLVDGKPLQSSTEFLRYNPSNTKNLISKSKFATAEQAAVTIKNIFNNRHIIKNMGWDKRIQATRFLADTMEKDRLYLGALIVLESGKPWKDADADVAEAIDFCRYYAYLAQHLSQPFKTEDVLGEDNFYIYEPKGVTVVIPPWNFPLAIPCGMVIASLVCGNATILKPAEDTCAIAFELSKHILSAGFPDECFAFLPGYGEEVGKTLVEAIETDIIAFTGSRQVGLGIIKAAASVQPNQRNIKKIIAEMGGKNCIIIDDDADLDEAIKHSLYSCFGYAGQKCSACSRIICVGEIYETFKNRFIEAAKCLNIGDVFDSATYMGPVISSEAQSRILDTIKNSEFKPTYQSETLKNGYYVPLTIYTDIDFNSSIWKEEIFGPVVAINKVNTFEDAVHEALNSDYALTGGLFSRNPLRIAYAKEHFNVGNLYINRGCTGAFVNRQPFGGSRMSGVGSKAGGPDYLLQFIEPRVITENVVRRGFVGE